MIETINRFSVNEILYPWVESCGGIIKTINFKRILNNKLSLIPTSTILLGTFLTLYNDMDGKRGFYCEILSNNLVFQELISYKHIENQDELIKLSLSHKQKLYEIIKLCDVN